VRPDQGCGSALRWVCAGVMNSTLEIPVGADPAPPEFTSPVVRVTVDDREAGSAVVEALRYTPGVEVTVQPARGGRLRGRPALPLRAQGPCRIWRRPSSMDGSSRKPRGWPPCRNRRRSSSRASRRIWPDHKCGAKLCRARWSPWRSFSRCPFCARWTQVKPSGCSATPVINCAGIGPRERGDTAGVRK